ncbi:hypothetical protein ACOME3_006499 [Neoechinorhynchus agilis]
MIPLLGDCIRKFLGAHDECSSGLVCMYCAKCLSNLDEYDHKQKSLVANLSKKYDKTKRIIFSAMKRKQTGTLNMRRGSLLKRETTCDERPQEMSVASRRKPMVTQRRDSHVKLNNIPLPPPPIIHQTNTFISGNNVIGSNNRSRLMQQPMQDQRFNDFQNMFTNPLFYATTATNNTNSSLPDSTSVMSLLLQASIQAAVAVQSSSNSALNTTVSSPNHHHQSSSFLQNSSLLGDSGYLSGGGGGGGGGGNGMFSFSNVFQTQPSSQREAPEVLSHGYKCKECEAMFHRYDVFIGHNCEVCRKQPYECEECSKRFSQQGNLSCHMRIHTGDKPFFCDICKKPFRHSNSLRRHIRTVHAPKSEPTTTSQDVVIKQENDAVVTTTLSTNEQMNSIPQLQQIHHNSVETAVVDAGSPQSSPAAPSVNLLNMPSSRSEGFQGFQSNGAMAPSTTVEIKKPLHSEKVV